MCWASSPSSASWTADDVTSILKDAAGGTTDMATARQWQWVISKWKNMGLTSEQALAQAARTTTNASSPR
jgi:ATP-dependent DNA helicase Rep